MVFLRNFWHPQRCEQELRFCHFNNLNQNTFPMKQILINMETIKGKLRPAGPKEMGKNAPVKKIQKFSFNC